jgi:hypothetical protein
MNKSAMLEALQKFSERLTGIKYNYPPGGYPAYRNILEVIKIFIEKGFMHRAGLAIGTVEDDTQNAICVKHAACDFPILWVDQGFLNAIIQSDPPEEIDLSRISWPFPAVCFLLPRNTLPSPSDGDCSWILIGRVNGEIICPISGQKGEVAVDTITCMTAISETGKPIASFYSYQKDQKEFRPFSAAEISNRKEMTCFTKTPDGSIRLISKADTEFTANTFLLGLKLVLAMSAKPEHLQSEQTGKADGAPRKLRDFREPRWLGRGYKVRKESSESEGAKGSVRFHWTRGHFRLQPHGPGRHLTKTIWIEPYASGVPV